MTFVVGGRYANKHGSYVVLAILGERMRVRMDDGRIGLLTVAIQERIWARMQERERLLAQGTAQGASAARPLASPPNQAGASMRGGVVARPSNSKEIQAKIGRLRRTLREARGRGDASLVRRIQADLVEERLRFCTLIRHRSAEELADLRRRFTAAVEHEYGSHFDYRNVCWVCKADVEVASNDQCACGWLICADGACQCPDFVDGTRGHQPRCEQQVQRIGGRIYEELVRERARVRDFWADAGGDAGPPSAHGWEDDDASYSLFSDEALPDWDSLTLEPPCPSVSRGVSTNGGHPAATDWHLENLPF